MQLLGKYGRGVDPRTKIGRSAHAPMSHCIVMVMANSAVISVSELTPSQTL